jgi:hypothetical protein
MAVVYLGSAVFKIARLTYVALFFVHLFACMFFRVKMEGADNPAEVVEFYTSRNVAEDVCRCPKSCSRTDHPKFY